MQIVRVYDASRQPRHWSELIEPGQCVIFASTLEGDMPCGMDGVRTSHDEATCAIVASLAEAEAICREHADRHPSVRFDVFDEAGRGRPPLMTVVNPSRFASLEGNAASRRRQRAIAIALIVAAPVLIWFDFTDSGPTGLLTVVAFNLLLFAGRLLQMNAGLELNERRRLDRIAGRRDSVPPTDLATRPPVP